MISGHWYSGPDQVDVPHHFLTATGTAVGDTITISFAGRPIPVRIVGEIFTTDLLMITDWQTLANADPGLAPDQYAVGLRAGTSVLGYRAALRPGLGPGLAVILSAFGVSTQILTMLALISALTVLLAITAALGVLSTVVMQTRERMHDIGVFKAIGMTPRQAITMMVCWVAGTGLAAGALAVPAGIALHRYVLPVMFAAVDTGSMTGGPEPTASGPCSPAACPHPRSSPHWPARRCPATSRAASGPAPGSRQRQPRGSSVSAVAAVCSHAQAIMAACEGAPDD